MRIDVGFKRGGPVHQTVKEYAEDHGLRHFQAYAKLIREGLQAEGYEVQENSSS